MLRSVKGDDAAGVFAGHYGIALPGRPGQAPALGLLEAVVAGFSEFPYENISKIVKRDACGAPPECFRLPLEVVTGHLESGLGGTCFSLTFLLERMLGSLGFDCRKVMAHMRMGENVHCLVVVDLEGRRYMIDPGYALHAVIALPGRGRTVVRRPHAEVEVLLDEAGCYHLYTVDAGGRRWRYRFRDVPAGDDEFERHWARSFDMPGLRNVCLARTTRKGLVYFRKDFLKVTSCGRISKWRLKTGRERVIEEEFGIDAAWVERARHVLEAERSGGRR